MQRDVNEQPTDANDCFTIFDHTVLLLISSFAKFNQTNGSEHVSKWRSLLATPWCDWLRCVALVPLEIMMRSSGSLFCDSVRTWGQPTTKPMREGNHALR